ncbi:hypothetical protein [Parachryseolinea silvisoli]|uniref:hypothetical protein n=1 Tax=Parachryseolinea silvisoli TaxID=2873601 RepID=UPI002265C0A8|nr:hypothetical protein [Parachryseolinea silvisoli]MCD9020184.1 hypothetical protein [Parachryseolinea silvisoli]
MKYIRGRFLLKAFAVFFLLEIITSSIAPAVSWALTSGPTAPEATTFEPVDATDMVDLKTGDFTYNLPLMEVPGPAGNYPLTLSHHSNIQPEEEASWVGLTWNLSPGAISRLVNGYPDDHNGVNNVNRDFWEGGNTETYTVGISVGIANGPSVSSSLSFANDTYRGYGVGWAGGFGMSLANGVGVGVQGGESPYGTTYSSFTLSKSLSGMGEAESMDGFSGTASITLNSRGGLNGGISANGTASTGGSISTDFNGHYSTSAQLGGVGLVGNSRAGNVSTEEDNFQIDIPIGYTGINLRLARNYQRYWIDETENINTYGSLYGSGAAPGNLVAFDTYDLLDTEIGMGHHTDGETLLGGSFSDVDFYSVTGQGIGGTIKPMFYQKKLFRQDKVIQGKTWTKSYELSGASDRAADFRFTGEFSNRMEYTAPDLSLNSAGTGLAFSFSGNLQTGASGAGNDGYVNGRLIGSRRVNWYKNSDILGSDSSLRKGFINAVARGFTRTTAGSLASQIGAFSITNESGVTYHYALPAYSYEEISRSQNTQLEKQKNGEYYNQVSRPEKYAYTWYLTSITGPDFVDRDNDGIADDGDWGYWVRFEYDKYLSDYKWRNPGVGYNPDIDDFDVFSAGKKEIYYLDKIYTQSHMAAFERSARFDSREVKDLMTGGFWDNNISARPRALLKLDKVTLYNLKDMSTSIRSVSFDYDYSLAPYTPNSYDASVANARLLGKLTLKNVKFLGKGGADLLPSMSFGYKNVRYEPGKYDMWGYYKNDYKDTGNPNLDRFTTAASASDVDAWSLTNIQTATGAEINIAYESDRYKIPTLYRRSVLTASAITINQTNQTVVVTFNNPTTDLTTQHSMLENSTLEFLFRRWLTARQFCICDGVRFPANATMGNIYRLRSATLTSANIRNVTAKTVEFVDTELYNFLYKVVTDPQGESAWEMMTYRDGGCFDSDSREIEPGVFVRYPILVAGNLFYNPGNGETYGGGSRVREIRVSDLGTANVTNYTYVGGTTSYEPISFGRINFDFDGWEDSELTTLREKNRIAEGQGAYRQQVLPNFSKLLSISRVLPGPGVLYNQVTVGSKTITPTGDEFASPSYAQYTFDVFKESMFGPDNGPTLTTPSILGSYGGLFYTMIHRKKVALKDYTSRIGNLREVTVFDRVTNAPLTSTHYNFFHDGLADTFDDNKQTYENNLRDVFSNQGVLEETSVRARVVVYPKFRRLPYGPDANTIPTTDQVHLIGVVGKKEYFPSISIGQTTINYKTGIKTVTTNKAFDFYSGAVTRSQYSDGYGNLYESEQTPAYRTYSKMGPAALNDGKNMLTQLSSGSVYKMQAANPTVRESLVGGWAQTWAETVDAIVPGSASTTVQQTGVWRKKSSFSFVGSQTSFPNADGFVPIGQISAFSAWTTQQPVTDGWQKNEEITLYDANSHVLEAMDMNGHYGAVRVNMDQNNVLATIGNARYREVASTGVEDIRNGGSGGGVALEQAIASQTYAHTGKISARLDGGKRGLYSSVLVKSDAVKRKIHVSFWTRDPVQSLSIAYRFVPPTGQAPAEALLAVTPVAERRAGDWYLCEADFDVPVNVAEGLRFESRIVNSGSQTLYIDDLRVHAADATMTTYVYNNYFELTHILDGNNLYQEYRYDGIGRLTSTYRESFQSDYGNRGVAKVNEVAYNYGKSNPFNVTITATSEGGPTGSIFPLGAVAVPQNGKQDFEIVDNCPSSHFSTLWIDNSIYSFYDRTLNLVDGTVVKIDGKTLHFSNVQYPHTILAIFNTEAPRGEVTCAATSYPDGKVCHHGFYTVTYYDQCGEIVNSFTAMSKDEVPAELRHLAADNCCGPPYNRPEDNCGCFHN